jgi:DNA-binding CsgD family transcriptional regulator
VTPKKLAAPKERPGRQKPVDLKVVEGMASVGATNCEIADFLGVSEALVRKRCGAVLTKARASLRTRLRQAQIKAALAGNPAMLIWLGKQMLGQVEKHEVSGTEGGHPIELGLKVIHEVIDPTPTEQQG